MLASCKHPVQEHGDIVRVELLFYAIDLVDPVLHFGYGFVKGLLDPAQ